MPEAKGFGGRKERRSEDAVSIGSIVDDLMRREVFSRGMPVAELASKWPSIVGERLAAETAPVAFEGGVLTVGVSTGPWGAQATFLAEQGVNPWSDMPGWVPAEGDTAGFARVSNAKALGAGLTFRPIVDTARATLAWFKAQPEERRSKLRAGLAPGREAEVLASWKTRGGKD